MNDEEWRTIPGAPYYQVSSMGRVKSLPHGTTKGKILTASRHTTSRTENTYLHVTIDINGKRKGMTVHRLVALAFLSPDIDKHIFVNHKNGIRNDNRLENLELSTALHNQLHSVIELGKIPLGNLSKHKETIEFLREKGFTYDKIGKLFGVPKQTVYSFVRCYETRIARYEKARQQIPQYRESVKK